VRGGRVRVSALHFEVRGRGPDLVLLHGWSFNLRVWDELAAALEREFRLIAIDLPGHGRSDWDARAATAAAETYRVHETLAQLTVRYALLGWSLGGQIALDLAAAMPAGIERLVLVGSTPRFLAGPGWRCGTAPRLHETLAKRLESDRDKAGAEFLALLARGSSPRTAARVRAKLREALRLQGSAKFEALVNGLARLASTDLRAALPLLRVPALVIAGRRDPIVRPAAGRALAAALPRARYAEFAGAAHAPFLSHPQKFAMLLRRFLRG